MIRKLINPQQIMFVCSANTCRSPMAEYLFNHIAESKGLKTRAISRASLISYSARVYAQGMNSNAIVALKAYDPKISGLEKHVSTDMKVEDFTASGLVLTMTESLRDSVISSMLLKINPAKEDRDEVLYSLEKKVFTLKEYAGKKNTEQTTKTVPIEKPQNGPQTITGGNDTATTHTSGTIYKSTWGELDIDDPIVGDFHGTSSIWTGGMGFKIYQYSADQDPDVYQGFEDFLERDRIRGSERYGKCRDEILDCLDVLFKELKNPIRRASKMLMIPHMVDQRYLKSPNRMNPQIFTYKPYAGGQNNFDSDDIKEYGPKWKEWRDDYDQS